MTKRKGQDWRMGGPKDVEHLHEIIGLLTVAMIEACPPRTTDAGTLATALVEIAAHAIAAGFAPDEQGAVVEHLQNHLAVARERWAKDHYAMIESVHAALMAGRK